VATFDGYEKSPDAALRVILRHCGVRKSTPHSSVLRVRMPTTAEKAGGGRNERVSPYQCAPQGKHLARLACGLFTKPSHLHVF